MDAREVMLVGSVPLKPASSVFDCACRHGLASLMKRFPDGEQAGWGGGGKKLEQNPALETGNEKLKMTLRPSTFFDRMDMSLLHLKKGVSPEDVKITEFGIAESAAESYPQFKKFKEEGKIAENARFCVTMPGPGTTMSIIALPPVQLFPMCERAYKEEIARILGVVPHDELTIQLDLAQEVETEEFHRRRSAFQLPIFEKFDEWNMDNMTTMIANIANAVPPEVELGFHLCALWHIDESQGQDLNVHVDWANMMSRKIKRPIGYVHVPTTPEFDEEDFAPLRRLKIHPETKLFIGVVHAQDGVEEAKRRIRAAAKFYPDFGIAAFCGLAQPSRKEFHDAHSVDDIFEMHRLAAEG